VDGNCGGQWKHHDDLHLALDSHRACRHRGGFGLRLQPGSSEWWLSRFLWLAANAIALVPLVVVFGRFERPRATEGAPAPAWRYVLGALMTVAGFALLAAQGVGGYGRFGLNVWGIEAFTIYGSSGTTPEPNSILLIGSGMLGLVGVLRRKLF
jgi:hypothetical protein